MDSFQATVTVLFAGEILGLFAWGYLYVVKIHMRREKDEFDFVRLFIVCKNVFSFAAVGLFFCPFLLIYSLFENPQKAAFIRIFSPAPFLVTGWMGIALGLWQYWRIGLRRPPFKGPMPVQIDDQIKEILLNDWDPMGIKDETRARAEYDDYVPQIKQMLHSGVTEIKLVAHLEAIAVDRMEMRSNIAESTVVARKLLSLIRR